MRNFDAVWNKNVDLSFTSLTDIPAFLVLVSTYLLENDLKYCIYQTS